MRGRPSMRGGAEATGAVVKLARPCCDRPPVVANAPPTQRDVPEVARAATGALAPGCPGREATGGREGCQAGARLAADGGEGAPGDDLAPSS